jgi:prevent-host-death family protein
MSKTRSVKLTEARSTFSAIVNEVYREQDRVIVEKSGIPVAAIVSLSDLERLNRFERERDERFKVMDEFSAAFSGVDQEEIEREAARSVAEARARLRAERESRKSA